MLREIVIGAHFFSLIILAYLCVTVLVKLKSTKREFLVLFLFCVFIYVLGTLLEIAATTIDGAIFGIWTRSLGGVLMMPVLFVFVQRYFDWRLPKIVNSLLFAVAFLLILLVWTAELHNLFYTTLYIYLEGTAPTVRNWSFSRGVFYPMVLIIYPAICAALSIAYLIWQAYRSNSMAQKMRLLLFAICIFAPVVGHILDFYQLNVYGMYNAVLVIPLVGALGYFVLFRYGLLENEETIRSQNWIKNMIANISHDIKTPLTVLSISIEKLLHASPGDPNYTRDIQIAYNQNLDLQRLIQNMIEVTRIDSVQNLYNLEWVSLNILLSDIQKKYDDYLESVGLQLGVSGFGNNVFIYADSIKIWSVLDNIIYNAVRHTPFGGNIDIVAECVNNTVAITIKDSGCGIMPEYLPQIFDRFYMMEAEKISSKGYAGQGLGLFIVKNIMKNFHGQVDIESEVGAGTSVILSFRKKTAILP